MKQTENKVAFDLTQPVQFLALGFGSGLAPKAPGTFGTLAAIPVFLLLTMLMPTPLPYALAVIVMGVAGIYICGKAADDLGVHDHPAIVWDEFVGFFITMFMVPVSWQSIAVGFVLFRVFDIFKPWPISFIDKKMTGGLGIMFDDVLAGVFALVIMHFIF